MKFIQHVLLFILLSVSLVVCGQPAGYSSLPYFCGFENPEDIIEDMKKGVVDNENLFCITDRRQAIKLATQLAKDKNDIILIAGKGHETYQEIEGVKYHFDDKEEILKY